MSKFTIDFFELGFLAEACVPPCPIARTSFWHDLIDKHYYIMSEDERERLYDWIRKLPSYNLENKDVQWFEARFNPDNQYKLHLSFEGKEETRECFLWEGRYYIGRNVSIFEDYIVSVEKVLHKDVIN